MSYNSKYSGEQVEDILGRAEKVVIDGDGAKFLADDGQYKTVSSKNIATATIDPMGDLILSYLTPNTVYICNGLVTGSLSISQSVTPAANYAEYNICFTTGNASSIPCSFPDTWIYANGQLPIFKANTSYEISIVYNKVGSQNLYKVVITAFESANTPQ